MAGTEPDFFLFNFLHSLRIVVNSKFRSVKGWFTVGLGRRNGKREGERKRKEERDRREEGRNGETGQRKMGREKERGWEEERKSSHPPYYYQPGFAPLEASDACKHSSMGKK